VALGILEQLQEAPRSVEGIALFDYCLNAVIHGMITKGLSEPLFASSVLHQHKLRIGRAQWVHISMHMMTSGLNLAQQAVLILLLVPEVLVAAVGNLHVQPRRASQCAT
jgi:hypothetical protein